MQPYTIHRPDPEAIHYIIESLDDRAAGLILRLAWQTGLLRDEIQHLTWDQVDLAGLQLRLPGRRIPLPEDLAAVLIRLFRRRPLNADRVVLSDRDRTPLAPPSISRLARTALDECGQKDVRLIDLRHDFVLRQLETRDWQEAARITGLDADGLRPYTQAVPALKKPSAPRAPAPFDEFAAWQLMQSEKNSPMGAVLWLIWQSGVKVDELLHLTWAQVDFDQHRLNLPERTVSLGNGAMEVLHNLRGTHSGSDYVLTSPRSGRPLDRARLSHQMRAALVRGGLDNVTLRDLQQDYTIRHGGEYQVIEFVRTHGSIDRNQAAELFRVSPQTAYNRLRQLAQRGTLTQIGTRYYLQGTVVPPEQHREKILTFLKGFGFAYRKDLADLLGIEPSQCRPILQRLIREGAIVQEHQMYHLPDA